LKDRLRRFLALPRKPNGRRAVARGMKIVRHEALGEIMNTLNDVANSITVEDLVKCYNSTVSQNTELEYYISGIK